VQQDEERADVDPYPLTDGTVLLTPPTLADAETIAALCQDDEVRRWTTVPDPYQLADAVAFVSVLVPVGWRDASTLAWAVRDAGSQALTGMVSLETTDGELGWWLGAAYRGRGWMTRAARLVAADAFERHHLDHLRWRAAVGNHASLAVARRLGFTLEGTVRRSIHQRGRWLDGWVGTLLPDELLGVAPG
jgi:RimJ/RimL family protein N-acetyltransferase